MHKLLRGTLVLTALLAMMTTIGLAQTQGAGQDMKDAGNATKSAAKDTGRASKKTAKKTAHAARKGTHKAAHKTRRGAAKVEDKTAPPPQ
ncbi:MAG TPA: hypothetical protein VFI95_02970 [Terriglobales bacterium]|nr:hypothetical protein [Terriglobales bacterium]